MMCRRMGCDLRHGAQSKKQYRGRAPTPPGLVAYAPWPGGIRLLAYQEGFSLGVNSHAGPPERPATSVRSGDRTAWVQLARVCHYLPITMCFGQETRPSALAPAARATNGQATAAPPSAAINSRLPIMTGMTLSVRGLPGKHTTT